MEIGLSGIVSGGVKKKDFDRILGQEIGVAITGNEKINTTFIVTEGCSKMKMAEHTYDILNSLDGKMASINGATQIALTKLDILYPECKGFTDFEEIGLKPTGFVKRIEDELHLPVTLIGTGPDQNEIIDRR